jgi:hypothetical protein
VRVIRRWVDGSWPISTSWSSQRAGTFTLQDRELGQDTFAVTTESGAIAERDLETLRAELAEVIDGDGG